MTSIQKVGTGIGIVGIWISVRFIDVTFVPNFRELGQSAAKKAKKLYRDAIDTPNGRGAAVVGLGIIIFLAGMIPTLVTDHNNFGTQTFDVGIFDQAVYQLSTFDHFMTTRGLNVFGHHANLGFFLLVPFYWLGIGGVDFLNIAAAVSMALAAVPIYLIGIKRIENAIAATAVAIAYLLNYSVSAVINEGFHPEKMAIPALFFAVYFAFEERWKPFTLAVVYAIIWKEDIPLFLIMLGLYIAITQSRKVGLATVGGAASYFVFVTRFLLPSFNDSDQTFYGSQYGDLGSSSVEIAANALIFKQDVALDLLAKNDGFGYLFGLGEPFGYLSFLSPHWLILTLPHLAANLLNIHGLAANVLVHYVVIPVVVSTLAVIATLRRFSASWLRYGLSAWMLGFALVTMVTTGFTPVSQNYREGVWQLVETEHSLALHESVDLVPDDAVVMGTYDILPHMTQRDGAYMYPNPFVPEYWGVAQENAHNPDVIEYVVLNLRVIRPDSGLHLTIHDSPSFEQVFLKGDVVVYKRVAPGL